MSKTLLSTSHRALTERRNLKMPSASPARESRQIIEMQPTTVSEFNIVIAVHNLEHIEQQLEALSPVVDDTESQITFVANGPKSDEIHTHLAQHNRDNGTSFQCLKAPEGKKGKDLSILHFMQHIKSIDTKDPQETSYFETNLIILDADSTPEDANTWLEQSKHHLEEQSSEGAFLISPKKYKHGVDVRVEAGQLKERIRVVASERKMLGMTAIKDLLPIDEIGAVLDATSRSLLSGVIQKRIHARDVIELKPTGTKYFGAGESYSVRLAKQQFDQELERYAQIRRGDMPQIWSGEDQWRIMLAKTGMTRNDGAAALTLMKESVQTEDAGKIPLASFAIKFAIGNARTLPWKMPGEAKKSWDRLSKEKYEAQNLGMTYDTTTDTLYLDGEALSR